MAVKKGPFLVCSKTGRIVGLNERHWWMKCVLPLLGLIALIWYLVRVIPKPSRAAYPCQRVAAPIAFGFASYVLGLAGATVAFRKARRYVREYRYLTAGICILIGLLVCFWAFNFPPQRAQAVLPIGFVPSDPPNSPMGVGKGIKPGRVAWAHNPDATSWNGSSNYWWSAAFNNQSVISDLLSKVVCSVGDKATVGEAWDAIFKYYNQNHGKGAVGYVLGEKIAVKININNNGGDNQIDASPQTVYALLDQLVNTVGVRQTDIIVYDAQRSGIQDVYNYCVGRFPSVGYNNWGGWVENSISYSSPLITSTNAKRLPRCVIDAAYVINMGILKRHHEVTAVTLCGKNLFGTMGDVPAMHATVGDWNEPMGSYNPIVDLMGSKYLGGKTVLYVLDALYGSIQVGSAPVKWNMAPFNNDWLSSMFASQDPVAIDSVALDFLNTEVGLAANADNYLHEAALVNAAPSGTVYRPDGIALTQSLGVHEHWNSVIDKQYSRNLGSGNGIELVKLTAAPFGSLPGLTVYYSFNETSGTTAADSSGGGRHATLVNGPTWAAGKIGNSVALDGSNDYVDVPNGVVSGLDDFAISAWVKMDSAGAGARVFDFGSGTNVNMFLSPRSASNTLRFAITTSGVGGEERIDGPALPAGIWKHVVVVLSGTTGLLYVDGREVARGSITLKPSSLGNTTENYIGRSQYPADPYLDGQVDEFQLYGRALTAGEVAYLYTSGLNCIGVVKNLGLGSPVCLTGKVVTGAFSDCFYIQCPEPGHTRCGIKVLSLVPPAVGATVKTVGTLSNDANDELVIVEGMTVSTGMGSPLPTARGCANRHLGGGTQGSARGPDGGAGINMVGVLQTTWGRAGSVVSGASMVVDDGSGCPVKVVGTTGVAANGSYVRVTGISSIVKDAEVHTRALRTRTSLDVRVVSGPTIVLPPPWVYYAFDETGGTVAADSSGNGKHATLVNGPTWVAGWKGNAVNLDGSNDYVSIPTGVVSGCTNCTIATWVKLDAAGTWSRIFDFGTGTTVNMFLTPKSGSNTLRFAITVSGGGGEQQINGPALATGVWKHVAVTILGSLGILYVDGLEVGRNSGMTLKPSSLGNTTQNWIGRSQYAADPYLDAQIDDFRIYNVALSASEVALLASQ